MRGGKAASFPDAAAVRRKAIQWTLKMTVFWHFQAYIPQFWQFSKTFGATTLGKYGKIWLFFGRSRLGSRMQKHSSPRVGSKYSARIMGQTLPWGVWRERERRWAKGTPRHKGWECPLNTSTWASVVGAGAKSYRTSIIYDARPPCQMGWMLSLRNCFSPPAYFNLSHSSTQGCWRAEALK